MVKEVHALVKYVYAKLKNVYASSVIHTYNMLHTKHYTHNLYAIR